jgi:hypothetical protein
VAAALGAAAPFLVPRGAPARQLTITQKRETCRAGEVRNGLKGNIGAQLDEVCVTPMNGRRQTVPACPFRADSVAKVVLPKESKILRAAGVPRSEGPHRLKQNS